MSGQGDRKRIHGKMLWGETYEKENSIICKWLE